MRLNRLVPVFLVLFLCGCATTPYSIPLSQKAKTQSPGKGIPYYLPHPYLVVTKNLVCVTAEKPESTASQASDQAASKQDSSKPKTTSSDSSSKNDTASNKDTYSMQVIYLPDADQKYALYYNRGTGTYDSAVTLVDGWKLTGLNTKGDSKTTEIIQAVGTALKDTASTAASVATGIAAFKAAVPVMEEEAIKPSVSAETPEVVGIWIYDLMGEMPFRCVFTWSMPEKK
jgi:hypothetical protein